MMFHDIHDQMTLDLHHGKGGGGVPSFWAQLHFGGAVRAARLTAFTEQHATSALHFGIGLLTNNGRGTAEPDDAAAFEAWGRGVAAWSSLCQAQPVVCRETLCRSSRSCIRAFHASPASTRTKFYSDNATWSQLGRPLVHVDGDG